MNNLALTPLKRNDQIKDGVPWWFESRGGCLWVSAFSVGF